MKEPSLVLEIHWILQKKTFKKKQELSTLENHRPLFKNIPLKMINSPGFSKYSFAWPPSLSSPHLLLFLGQLCSTHRPGSSTPSFSISTQVPISKRKKPLNQMLVEVEIWKFPVAVVVEDSFFGTNCWQNLSLHFVSKIGRTKTPIWWSSELAGIHRERLCMYILIQTDKYIYIIYTCVPAKISVYIYSEATCTTF